MRICPCCGNPVSDKANFCQECGADVRNVMIEEVDDQKTGDDDEGNPAEEFDDGMDSIGETDEEADPEAETVEEIDDGYDSSEDTDVKTYTRRKARPYYAYDEDQYSKEGKKTLTLGIVLAVLICVVGIGVYFVVSNMLKQEPKIDVGSGFSDKQVQVTPAPTESPDAQDSEETPITVSSESEEPEEPAAIQAMVTTNDPDPLNEYVVAGVSGTQESSVLEEDGMYHVSGHMVDGQSATSWQEGSDGDGTGEWVQVQLDREYSVRYLTFMMGNWKSERLYYANNRPSKILLKLDDQEFYLDFPDEMRTFTVELSEDCQASSIYVQVQGVYNGSSWSDCCISEMTVYGR